MATRTEEDSFGQLDVPAGAYYGIFTARAARNFPGGVRFPEHFYHSYAVVKKAACRANMKLGKLDKKRGKAVEQACDEIVGGRFADQFILTVYQAGAGTSTNMNLNEVIANRALEILGRKKGDYDRVHPNDHVNMSQSTNDTFHSAMNIASATMIFNSLLPDIDRLRKSLEKMSKKFSSLVKSGRTHTQYAVPLTLGDEFGGYAAVVKAGAGHVKSDASSLLELPLGGTAVGTGINAGAKYAKLAVREVAEETGLKFRPAANTFAAMQNFSSAVRASAALKAFALDLMKISRDLQALSSSDIMEIELPAVQPGSSIMPGKVNPSVPESVEMVCCRVVGNDAAIAMAAAGGRLEVNVLIPVAAHALTESVTVLSNACRILSCSVDGIKADKAAVRRHLERNPAVAAALNEKLGYDTVAGLVKESEKKGKSVRELAVKKNLLTKKEADKLLDPEKLSKGRKG